MSLLLHFHPLSSFCHKALIAFYEKELDFETKLVDLGDPQQKAQFRALWPIGKFPVLEDRGAGRMLAESTVIIEYVDLHHPGARQLIPQDSEDAFAVRMHDRFFDHYIHHPMQKIVGDRIRPPGAADPHGVDEARDLMRRALDMVERDIAGTPWLHGDSFTLADCAAAPALFYADKVMPLAIDHPQVAAYLERLRQRPSYARVLEEAAPYFAMFPA